MTELVRLWTGKEVTPSALQFVKQKREHFLNFGVKPFYDFIIHLRDGVTIPETSRYVLLRHRLVRKDGSVTKSVRETVLAHAKGTGTTVILANPLTGV